MWCKIQKIYNGNFNTYMIFSILFGYLKRMPLLENKKDLEYTTQLRISIIMDAKFFLPH
jgi:hypothetical protein